MQLKSEAKGGKLSTFEVIGDLFKKEGGVKAFYKGYPLKPTNV